MIVGIKDNSLLDFKIEIETNHIKVYIKKGELPKIEEFINKFNSMLWEDKSSEILEEEITDEDVIRNKVKEYVKKKTDLNLFTFDDFVFEEETFNNIRGYNGDFIDVVDNMQYFTNKILPVQVLDMIKGFSENIEPISVEDVSLDSFLTGISDYVLYMGPNPKYRGCIGKVVKTREDAASQLVEFPNKFRESGNIARFWSKPVNIVSLSE